jgi:hypothetical protein
MNLPSGSLLHLGRKTGPVDLEMKSVRSENIRLLGNWNPSIQETTYSSSIHIIPVRAMAGFVEANGMYYNPRTVMDDGLEVLMANTPFARFSHVPEMLLQRIRADKKVKCYTAYEFASFMNNLNKVFIQDAATMLIKHPDRIEHSMFTQLAVFQMPEWTVSF